MIITKEFEVGMNITDTIMFFADENNLLRALRKIYTGKCLFGANIIEILRVIKQSECMINQDGNPNFGTISVVFEASAEVFVPGEIINGVKIDNIGVDVITCSTPRTSIIIRAHPMLRYLRAGQIISARVGMARYTRGESKISVSAMPMLPTAACNIYRIGPVSADVMAVLNDVQKRIEFEEKEKKNIAPAVWKMFDTLLYAFKTPQKAAGTIPFKEVLDNLTEFTTLNDAKFIFRDPKLGSEPAVCVYESSESNTNPSHPTGDPNVKLAVMPNFDATLLVLLEDYCARLRTIREMSTIYTGPLVTEHENLWKIFIANKI